MCDSGELVTCAMHQQIVLFTRKYEGEEQVSDENVFMGFVKFLTTICFFVCLFVWFFFSIFNLCSDYDFVRC